MNNYNILVLGASGSGKTSFLSSSYDRLSVQRREIGFFVDLPEDERIILVNKYREMEDPTKDWPPGTKDVKEWVFTCSVRATDRNYELLKFSYLDYAGGILVNLTEKTNSTLSIDKAANGADAMLVLLDGLKILYQMEGSEDKLSSPLHNDLRFILPIIQKHMSTPIHFVITKWDLLEDKYTLKQIRDMLFEDERFEAIISQRRVLKNPTRLIPVSAVGKGFATLHEDNIMKKNPRGMAKPFQVEIPIACVLIDGFQIAQRNLTKKQRDALSKKTSYWRTLGQKLVGASEAAVQIPLPPQYNLPQSIIKQLLNWANKEIKESIEELKQERDQLAANISNQEDAMGSLLKSYYVLVGMLEKDFPESDLHRA